MNATPQTQALLPWRDLQNTMTSPFIARADDLLANKFSISGGDSTFGCLLLRGLHGAEFTAGTLESTIERTKGGGYTMFYESSQILASYQPASSLDTLELTCGGDIYLARISFLRNQAIACSSTRDRASALLEGNMTGRRYEVTMDADDDSLPVAILLLYHTATFRRRLFLAGKPAFSGGRVRL